MKLNVLNRLLAGRLSCATAYVLKTTDVCGLNV